MSMHFFFISFFFFDELGRFVCVESDLMVIFLLFLTGGKRFYAIYSPMLVSPPFVIY